MYSEQKLPLLTWIIPFYSNYLIGHKVVGQKICGTKFFNEQGFCCQLKISSNFLQIFAQEKVILLFNSIFDKNLPRGERSVVVKSTCYEWPLVNSGQDICKKTYRHFRNLCKQLTKIETISLKVFEVLYIMHWWDECESIFWG